MKYRRGNEMKKILNVFPERCTACRVCELACSKRHEGTFDPDYSRIKPEKSRSFFVPFTCFQCEDAPCARVCPSQAIHRSEDTTTVWVDKEKCVGCKLCMLACPFGMIVVVAEKGIAIKCDLCEGDPECVKYCIPEALKFEEPSEDVRLRMEKILQFPSFLSSDRGANHFPKRKKEG